MFRYMDSPSEPFLNRLRLKNFRSIEKCDVEFRSFTILVGRNGAGKSNVLDALRFVMDALQTSLDHAIKSRGGIDEVRRRSTGHPRNFAIQMEISVNGARVKYAFEVAAKVQAGFVVKHEILTAPGAKYHVEKGALISASTTPMPPVADDRLYLVNAAGLPEFRRIYDELISMGFYNLNPEAMKQPQTPDAGELLHRDGGNIASVIARLARDQPASLDRIKQYLRTIVPGITDVTRISLGAWETLEFKQDVIGSLYPWAFYASSMSDGTLRSLGALVAATQLSGTKSPVSLIGIEEPETALHPAAAGALMDAMREATSHTQVIITSHSPDLLDQVAEEDRLLAVQSVQGTTQVGPVDAASRKAIKDHLYTPGELLRMDQLSVDRTDLERQQSLRFFDEGEA
jgi:predicted ATPase